MSPNSASKLIKNAMKELLEDGVSHTRKEIVAYANNRYGKVFTDGEVSNAINWFMVENSGYVQVCRGVYAKDKEDTTIANEVISRINNTVSFAIREVEAYVQKKEHIRFN